MTEILMLIKERHSLRSAFDQDRLLSEEELKKILEAAHWAPTAHNMQNFEIVIVDNKEILKNF